MHYINQNFQEQFHYCRRATLTTSAQEPLKVFATSLIQISVRMTGENYFQNFLRSNLTLFYRGSFSIRTFCRWGFHLSGPSVLWALSKYKVSYYIDKLIVSARLIIKMFRRSCNSNTNVKISHCIYQNTKAIFVILVIWNFYFPENVKYVNKILNEVIIINIITE